LVWADDLARQGRAGQALGQTESPAFAVPELHDGALTYPLGAATESLTTDDLFPGAGAGSAIDFSALYGDDEALGFRGRAVQADLRRVGSAHGAAFQTLYGSYGLSDADLRNDPVWSQTDPILADMAGVTAEFADWAIESTFHTGSRSVHLLRIETCQQVQQGGSCTIRHHYDLPPAEHGISTNSGAVVSSCGHGCVQVEYDDRGWPSSARSSPIA